MEDMRLSSDALAHVAYWARSQPWFPREAKPALVFTDEIRLHRAHASILFARSGPYAFIIPVAISRAEHSASFALVNDHWLVDGLEHAETLQELLDAATGHVHTACLRGSGSARLRPEDNGGSWHLAFRRVLRGDASIEGQLHDALYTGGSLAMPQVLTRLTADWSDGDASRVSEFMLIRERWPGERTAVEVLTEAAMTPDDLAPSTTAARRLGEVIHVLHQAAEDTARPGASRSLHIVEEALATSTMSPARHAWLRAECDRFRRMQHRMRPASTLPGLTVDSMLIGDHAAGFFDLASDYRGDGLNADDVGRIAFGIVCIADRASDAPLTEWVIATINAFAAGAHMDSPAELVSMRIAMIAEALSVLHGQPTLAVPRSFGRDCAEGAALRTLDYLSAHGAARQRRQIA